jgi:hypothetical protein
MEDLQSARKISTYKLGSEGQRDKVLCMTMITTDAQIVTTTKQKQALNFSTAFSVRKIKNS